MKLEELKKLCDEATAGPWIIQRAGWVKTGAALDYIDAGTIPNAEFIAGAREALPKLIAVAEAARPLVERFYEGDGNLELESFHRLRADLAALEAE